MFGDRLKTLRQSHNLTQIQLAEKIKLSPSAIGMYEQNRRTPDINLLSELSKLFNVTTDYLLGVTDETGTLSSVSNESLPISDNNDKDVANDLEKVVRSLELQQDGIMFYDHPLDDETREILIMNLKHTIELGKKFSKTGLPTSEQKIKEVWGKVNNN